MDELITEAQKPFVQRDEEKMITKARIMMAVTGGGGGQFKPVTRKSAQTRTTKNTAATTDSATPRPVHCNCKKGGNVQKNCLKRLKDPEAFHIQISSVED